MMNLWVNGILVFTYVVDLRHNLIEQKQIFWVGECLKWDTIFKVNGLLLPWNNIVDLNK